MCKILKKLCTDQCTDPQPATQNDRKDGPEDIFVQIDEVARRMNARLVSGRPKTGCWQRVVTLLAAFVLVAIGFMAVCAAESLCEFVGETLLQVSGQGALLLPTSVVIVTIIISTLAFSAVVATFLILAWKLYKYVDGSIAKDEARKVKEYEVYERKLYAYYDKTLEKIWEKAYSKPQPQQQEVKTK